MLIIIDKACTCTLWNVILCLIEIYSNGKSIAGETLNSSSQLGVPSVDVCMCACVHVV